MQKAKGKNQKEKNSLLLPFAFCLLPFDFLMTLILTAGWLLPITSPPIVNGAIAVSGDTIAAVGTLADLQSRFPDSVVRDLGLAAILPGLINVHSHLELSVFRGRLEAPGFQRWIAELVRLKRELLTPQALLASAKLGCIEAIRAGITTVADTAEADAVLPALIESGQRGLVYQECFGPRAEQAEGSITALEQKLDSHTERLARADSEACSRLSIGISPHAPYTVSGELYRRAAELAGKRNLDLALHVAESEDEDVLLRNGTGTFADALRRRGIDWLAPGCSTIAYLDQLDVLERGPLLIHCVTADERDLELMASRGARLAHCPKSNAKFGHGIAPFVEARRRGIRVGLGTDSVASNNTCDMIEEARWAALLHRAASRDGRLLEAAELLRLMTIDGARCLGMDSRIGSLEPGKQADLIAIDFSKAHSVPHYDPESAIVFSSSGRDCVLTMVAGRLLYDGERVSTFDEEDILA
jgi:5-methylthioadenosine/S-adenosylhomocysteine deaminase